MQCCLHRNMDRHFVTAINFYQVHYSMQNPQERSTSCLWTLWFVLSISTRRTWYLLCKCSIPPLYLDNIFTEVCDFNFFVWHENNTHRPCSQWERSLYMTDAANKWLWHLFVKRVKCRLVCLMEFMNWQACTWKISVGFSFRFVTCNL